MCGAHGLHQWASIVQMSGLIKKTRQPLLVRKQQFIRELPDATKIRAARKRAETHRFHEQITIAVQRFEPAQHVRHRADVQCKYPNTQ